MTSLAFLSSAGPVAGRLIQCTNDIRNITAAFNAAVPVPHTGADYEAAIIPYRQEMADLRRGFARRIDTIARGIGFLSQGTDWDRNKTIVGLWIDFAQMVRQLSDHPTKKVACVIIDGRGHLQSWGVNRTPVGLPLRAAHYIKGERRNYIVCAERAALARLHHFDLSDYQNKNAPTHRKKQRGFWMSNMDAARGGAGPTDADVRSAVVNFTETLAHLGARTDMLRQSVMISTSVPCQVCAPSIIAHRPRKIIADMNGGSHFSRRERLQASRDEMQNAGIPVIAASDYPTLQLL